MAIRVGRWDCPACGTKKILGPETRCPNCGAPRPPRVKFYLVDESEEVTEKAQLKAAKAGADWICGHCNAQNKASELLCHACGNPRDETSEDREIQTRTYSQDEVPTTGGLHESEEAGDRYRREHRAKIESTPGYKRKRPKGLIRLLLASPVLAAALFFLLKAFPQTIEVEVIGFEWERTIQFEHYEPVQKEDWQVPPQASDVKSFRAIHHHEKVFKGYETRTRTVRDKVGEERYVCGQKDLGNGYFEDKYCTRPIYQERQEEYQAEIYDNVPVYKTKYRFTVMEWVAKSEYLQTLSGGDHDPRWPGQSAQRDADRWRAGKKQESYRLIVREQDGDEHNEAVSYAYWAEREKGQKIPAKRSRILDIYYGLKMNED